MKTHSLTLKDGRKLSFDLYGAENGTPILCLHGTPASKFMFENFHGLAKKLNFSLIAPSRPGIGKSSYKIFNRLSDYSEDIKELMAKQNISSCHLIGVSGGGPYAFALANSIPENFLSLNLISALGPIDKKNLKKMGTPQKLILVLFKKNKFLASCMLKVIFKYGKRFKRIFLKILCFHSSRNDKKALKNIKIRDSLIKSNFSAFESGVEGIMQDIHLFLFGWEYKNKYYNGQINIWHGKDDPTVPVEMANFYTDFFKNAKFIPIENGGHHWFYENMEKILVKLIEK